MKTKCKLKYFWHGFKNALNPNMKSLYLCPHCCNEVSEDEYNNMNIFVYGCEKCKDEHQEGIEVDVPELFRRRFI